MPINVHGGTGVPDYGDYPFAMLFYINEAVFYSQRPFVQFVLGGIFERFPRLKFAITETQCSWVPKLLKDLDGTIDRIRKTGRTGRSVTATSTSSAIWPVSTSPRTCGWG